MKYPASEKLEIIRMVERSHLSVRRTLENIGVSRPTFYRWYDLYRRFGEKGLEDRRCGPGRAWNRIPNEVRNQVLDMALERTELSPRELAVTFTDEREYFISEASVYRLLKAYDLITSPAFTVVKAANEFKDKTTAPNQLWQTDFTWLGLVLSFHDPRRLLALHHRLEALYDDESRRCHRHPGDGARRIRARSGQYRAQAAPAVRQRLKLHCR